MINCYVGKPGKGKTYALVRLAYKAIKRGRNVHSNFFIDFRRMGIKKGYGSVYFWKDIQELVKIREGEILMDEAQIYINSRDYWNLPKQFQYKIQQHRKHGVNLHLAVQNISRIDKVARELVNSVFQMRRIGRIFIASEYDVEDIDKVKKDLYSRSIFLLSKKLASCYDTLQEIHYEKSVLGANAPPKTLSLKVRDVSFNK